MSIRVSYDGIKAGFKLDHLGDSFKNREDYELIKIYNIQLL